MSVFFQHDGQVTELPAPVHVTFEPEAQAIIRCMTEVGEAAIEIGITIADNARDVLDALFRAAKRKATLRAQMRRKGRPGWRHWRGSR